MPDNVLPDHVISEHSREEDLESTVELSPQERRELAGPPTGAVDPAVLGIRVRELVWADVTQVAAIESQLFGPSAWTMGMLTEELRGTGRWYIGAHPIDDGGHTPLVGYGGIWYDGEHTHIMTIGVHPEWQGAGIGQALMTQLVLRARQIGAHTMLLEVAVNNPAAIAMYTRAGFERIGLRKRYYQPEDVDAYTMQLVLKDRVPPIGEPA